MFVAVIINIDPRSTTRNATIPIYMMMPLQWKCFTNDVCATVVTAAAQRGVFKPLRALPTRIVKSIIVLGLYDEKEAPGLRLRRKEQLPKPPLPTLTLKMRATVIKRSTSRTNKIRTGISAQ